MRKEEEVSDWHPFLLSKMKWVRSPPGFPLCLQVEIFSYSSALRILPKQKKRVFVSVSVVEGNGDCGLPPGLSFFAQDGVPGL